LSILYLSTVPLTFSSIDEAKHRLHNLSPEYCLWKKVVFRWHLVQRSGRGSIDSSQMKCMGRYFINKPLTIVLWKETINLASKPASISDDKEVRYNNKRWTLLNELRQKAQRIMSTLENSRLHSITYGSIARGDVKSHSDVDVFVAEAQSAFLVESALEKAGIRVCRRLVVQATPNYAMKAHLEIDEVASVSFPLMPMRRVEREFYKFGGEVTLAQIKDKVRVRGVDKRLMLIEPNDGGHSESSVLGREEQVAKILGITYETVSDRTRALLRRNVVGRTGVFVKKELREDDTFEMVLKNLAERNPAVRRRFNET
jgi:uncharacterized protein